MGIDGVAVTGASGFIGRAMVAGLAGQGLAVRALSRGAAAGPIPAGVTWHRVPGYGDAEALAQALDGARLVVHLADNPDRAQARSAEEGAETIAALGQAMVAMGGTGPARLVVASSLYARLAPAPGGYGHAKARVEAAVADLQGVQRIVLRLPPVYGPGGGGGFATLAKLAGRGWPIPFGRAHAPRDYLARSNLVALIAALAQAGDAAGDATGDAAWTEADGQIFEPSDGHPIGTAALARAMATAQGKPARLIGVPLGLLRLAGRLTGKGAMISGAIDPLAAGGNGDLTRLFGWTPHDVLPDSLAFLTAQGAPG